ncbi:MAG: alpha/beta fold hydrolase [Candidatus Omnitrophica bacterium]|nr:alpha/beta fold hydrolase [Candidatus Omnitrophota bacterium]
MMPVLTAFVIMLLAVYLIRYIENKSLFFPMKEVTTDPDSIGLLYEEVYFETADGRRLNGWFIPRDGSDFTVIFCHGNAGNIGHRLSKLSMLNELDLSVFIFDYRGFGKSEGVPREKGLYTDALAAYEYISISRGVPENRIILYGESLGAAVSAEVAAKKRPEALVTEEAFTCLRDMAKKAYPYVPHFIFSSRLDTMRELKKAECPKLIMHSIDDEIVFYDLGEKLFREARSPKEFLQLRGTHTTAFLDSKELYQEGLSSFLEKIRGKK